MSNLLVVWPRKLLVSITLFIGSTTEWTIYTDLEGKIFFLYLPLL